MIGGPEKLIILDHGGKLALTTATREGLTVHSQVEIVQREAFTVPTIVETLLFLRDEVHIMALYVGGEG